MKRTIAVILIITCLFAFVGCGKKNAGVVNPMVECESASELYDMTGINLTPAEEFEAQSYFAINGKLAQLDFKYNGSEYTLRGENTDDEDISGVYGDDVEPYDFPIGDITVSTYDYGDDGLVALWHIDDMSFSLHSIDSNDYVVVLVLSVNLTAENN